jgi:hypothetical protein
MCIYNFLQSKTYLKMRWRICEVVSAPHREESGSKILLYLNVLILLLLVINSVQIYSNNTITFCQIHVYVTLFYMCSLTFLMHLLLP